MTDSSDKNRNTLRLISADELRSMFLAFYEQRGHAVIPSASLIPENDPSVLFTTAGMHPLVPNLLGQAHPSGDKLTNCQKCVRTNDITEVGDSSHLTFFEMLGVWSLGAYFKQDSIRWSFEFLTGEEYLGLPLERIYVSVFEGNAEAPRDEEAARLWREQGIAEDHIVFLSAEHNWWAVGPEGPCGPDSEVFVDVTQKACANGAQCSPGACECGRWFEIWNNVFMTFQRQGGKLSELPKRNVDTGVGFERTLAVLNGCDNVFEVSCFAPIVDGLLAKAGVERARVDADEDLIRALRILADHLRTSVFILGDEHGVSPGNQGQAYVLRRLIRRAIRYCEKLELDPVDWVATAQVVIDVYAQAYPELHKGADKIHAELTTERERFQATLRRGTRKLEAEMERLRQTGEGTISGELAFHLYDTYGFPIEFTEEIAAENGLRVDREDYERHFSEHRDRSRTEAAASGLADQSEESIRYHTATHLLHSALRKVLGDHVHQKGSNITKERLRFDFTHTAKMTPEEIARVEQLVQEQIDKRIDVRRAVTTQEKAREMGAIGLFNDKYEGDVSVYSIGDFSLEFCGGPHVANTGEIGTFKIVKEQSSGAGVRRIRAVCK